MSRWKAIGRVVGGGVALCTLVCAGALYAWPMEILLGLQRTRLTTAGLERHEMEGPRGRLVWFEGGQGSPVVLVHGFGDQAGTWGEVVDDLLVDHHLIVIDLPGHGQSEPVDPPLAMADELAGLSAVLEARLPDEPVAIVGNSMGGWISMRYALAHPERVRRIVPVNAAGLKHAVPREKLIAETREDMADKIDMMFADHAPMLPGFVADGLIAGIDQPRYYALFEDLQEGEHVDETIGTLAVPADLVWGSEDQFFPMDYAKRLDALIPDSRLHVLSGCGHPPQLTCPDELAAVLVAILAD